MKKMVNSEKYSLQRDWDKVDPWPHTYGLAHMMVYCAHSMTLIQGWQEKTRKLLRSHSLMMAWW